MTLSKQPEARYIDAAPYASALIEGHRDFGYSLKTALADIIDNSISAGADRVRLVVDTISNSPSVIIADNGCGMSKAELLEAMRLGSKNPT
ncbi:ATP-binding protein, partial [Vibrio anguillarum]|nr:ATP-binding protein [Vibrio anguillarum]